MRRDGLWARTDRQIEVLNIARRRGGLCAWCGRTLADGETVYFRRIAFGSYRPRPDAELRNRSYKNSPLCSDCAPPEVVSQATDDDRRPCLGCGRPMVVVPKPDRFKRQDCSNRCHQRMQGPRGATAPRRLDTAERIARLDEAQRRATTCVWCGRAVDKHEPIYMERFAVSSEYRPAAKISTAVILFAPIGLECVTPTSVRLEAWQDPEPCAACGRLVHRSKWRWKYGEIYCSRECKQRFAIARLRSHQS